MLTDAQCCAVGDPPTRVFLRHFDFPIPEKEASIAEISDKIVALFPTVSKAGNLDVLLGETVLSPAPLTSVEPLMGS